ncbi:MAG: quinolinate synthase NadA [Candidatus Cloacimonetes bacterium]|nr:quinolinate synthase NadA [Candidatus Cloacimonadota bacterium]
MTNIDWNSLSNEDLFQIAEKLKREKNCFVLAHNYQSLEVQKIADFVGDSLQMAQVAAQANADMILVCGVRIMAETAKILNPEKKVLLSHPDAGCPLAEMKKVSELRDLKSKYSNAEVVCYVNSTTDLKAESTITCTSANVSDVISNLTDDKEIIFVPDSNIGKWAAFETGRKIIMWDGFCPVHDQITLHETKAVKEKFPDHKLIVHPECKFEVCKLADHVCSTKQMIDYVQNNDKVIIGTEIGLYYQLADKYPGKDIVPLSETMVCPDMQKTTLKSSVQTLTLEQNEIDLPEKLIKKARKSLDRMIEMF